MLFRSDSVRHKFPLQATYFRRVLPHVRGFPTLRVLPANPTSAAQSAFFRCSQLLFAYLIPSRMQRISQVPDVFISNRAMFSDPASVSAALAIDERLLLPSRGSNLSATGCCCYEAQSLHAFALRPGYRSVYA